MDVIDLDIKGIQEYSEDKIYLDDSIVPIKDKGDSEERDVDPYSLMTDIELNVVTSFREGLSNIEIAKKLDMPINVVRNIFKRKHVVSIVADCVEEWNTDLKSLDGLVVEVLKRNLISGEEDKAIKAADMVLKARGKYTRVEDKVANNDVTAEDIMKKLIGINININQSSG